VTPPPIRRCLLERVDDPSAMLLAVVIADDLEDLPRLGQPSVREHLPEDLDSAILIAFPLKSDDVHMRNLGSAPD
jgi:hypothetical protein